METEFNGRDETSLVRRSSGTSECSRKPFASTNHWTPNMKFVVILFGFAFFLLICLHGAVITLLLQQKSAVSSLTERVDNLHTTRGFKDDKHQSGGFQPPALSVPGFPPEKAFSYREIAVVLKGLNSSMFTMRSDLRHFKKEIEDVNTHLLDIRKFVNESKDIATNTYESIENIHVDYNQTLDNILKSHVGDFQKEVKDINSNLLDIRKFVNESKDIATNTYENIENIHVDYNRTLDNILKSHHVGDFQKEVKDIHSNLLGIGKIVNESKDIGTKAFRDIENIHVDYNRTLDNILKSHVGDFQKEVKDINSNLLDIRKFVNESKDIATNTYENIENIPVDYNRTLDNILKSHVGDFQREIKDINSNLLGIGNFVNESKDISTKAYRDIENIRMDYNRTLDNILKSHVGDFRTAIEAVNINLLDISKLLNEIKDIAKDRNDNHAFSNISKEIIDSNSNFVNVLMENDRSGNLTNGQEEIRHVLDGVNAKMAQLKRDFKSVGERLTLLLEKCNASDDSTVVFGNKSYPSDVVAMATSDVQQIKLQGLEILEGIQNISTNQLSRPRMKRVNSTSAIDCNANAVVKETFCSHTGDCSDYKVEPKHCYKSYETKMSWSDAQKYCTNVGGYLVEINSLSEVLFLKRLPDAVYWLGATDSVTEGEWVWQHSGLPMVLQSWGRGEPNNNYHNVREEHCLCAYRKLSHWNDEPCGQDNKHSFTCERDDGDCTWPA